MHKGKSRLPPGAHMGTTDWGAYTSLLQRPPRCDSSAAVRSICTSAPLLAVLNVLCYQHKVVGLPLLTRWSAALGTSLARLLGSQLSSPAHCLLCENSNKTGHFISDQSASSSTGCLELWSQCCQRHLYAGLKQAYSCCLLEVGVLRVKARIHLHDTTVITVSWDAQRASTVV